MFRSLYKCPRCKNYPGFGELHRAFITANDGGSTICHKCGCLHHVCIGTIKIGSPGPQMCPICSGQPKTEDKIQSFEPKCCASPLPNTTTPVSTSNINTDFLNSDMRLPFSVRAARR